MDLNTLITSAIIMMLVGLGFIYMIIRNKQPKTRTPAEWIGVGLSALLIVFSGMLLVMGLPASN